MAWMYTSSAILSGGVVMLRPTPVPYSMCNVMRGVWKLSVAFLPSHTPSPPSPPTPPTSSAALREAPPLSAEVTARFGADAFRRPLSSAVHRAVPSTRAGRAFGFAALAAQVGWDRVRGGSGHERVVETLCRMRGAVLKLGQMLSLQDGATVPPHVTALFARVRDGAYGMPAAQLQRALRDAFGRADWREAHFAAFDDAPAAAASIGEVHRAVLRDPPGAAVAVKVQYPGVAASIDADLGNLRALLALQLLPPGMFVDRVLRELRAELALECRYDLEAAKQTRYAGLLRADPHLRACFVVPHVYERLSSPRVLVTEFVEGVAIDRLDAPDVPRELRDYIAQHMTRLTLTELFRWRFMQTDPNYANFLFNPHTRKVALLDFGAAREFDAPFVREYLEVVAAAAREERDAIIAHSIRLGFLTGNEMREMLDAHVASVTLLGKPFRHRERAFDFAAEHLPSQIQSYVPTMIKLRLRPPPTPVYSLHRRLSGTILLATKLRATVPAGEYFWDIYDNFESTISPESTKREENQKESEVNETKNNNNN